MKKWIAILLIISLICSLSACSNSMKSTETLNEETPSAESVPSSTPVSTSTEISDIDFSLLGLSDLETTYAMEAYSQGISWKELYDNPDDDISMKDMLALIKNADRLFFGDDKSNFLNWFSYEENEKATRIRAAEIIYNRQMERVFNIESSGDAFYEEKDDKINSIESSWIQFPYASLVGKCSDGTIGEFFLWEDCLDLDIIDAVGDSSAVNYVTWLLG